jgi:hypothetical protein
MGYNVHFALMKQILIFSHIQEALLSVTNTFEGTAFVNQSVNVTAAQYSSDLFPKFRTPQANSVGELYAGLGTKQFQVNGVQGECEFNIHLMYYKGEH